MLVYQLIEEAYSQQPCRKIIYASQRLYLVKSYEGCCTPSSTPVQASTGRFVEVQHSINRLINALF
jgi:hypothetical protein